VAVLKCKVYYKTLEANYMKLSHVAALLRVHFLGYRTVKNLLLVCVFTQTYLYCYPSLFINPLLIRASIFTHPTPVVGILTFYSYLNTKQCNPNTGQEAR